jgi:hypothetical protein
MPTPIVRPGPDEYAPYYAGYITEAPGDDALALLEQQQESTLRFLSGIPESKGDARYAPGKWSVKEVVGHVLDSERIFAYRALRIGRGDRTRLPGFDEKAYIPAGNFGARSFADLAEEYADARRATISLFRRFDAEALARRGIANELTISTRALAYILAGHENHHLNVIRTRYL